MAQNDAVTVSEDVPFSSSISLLANDSDVDGDSLSVVAGTFERRASGPERCGHRQRGRAVQLQHQP
ncbi:Ig-like domain-containing protein, partial [Pseudomonas stutzeri]|nr:Ig-like domain-containing protein [Stutzerimonas stutzeri]